MQRFGLLCLMRVFVAGVDFELPEHLRGQLVLGKHAADGFTEDLLGVLFHPHTGGLAPQAGVACVQVYLFRSHFLPVNTTLSALMTTTKSPVSTWGV